DEREHLRLREVGEARLPADLLHDLGDRLHGGADRRLLLFGEINHGPALPRQTRPEALAGHRAEPDRGARLLRPHRVEPAKATGGSPADSTERSTRMPEPPDR